MKASTPYFESPCGKAALIRGDCLAVLASLPAESVDAVVTDPPAGIAFMGKAWDRDKGGRDQWIAWMAEVAAATLAACKPGAHALVWALPRTSHWTATAWEDAGWEVRDRVSHLFGTGFPKSLDVSKAMDKAAGAEREVVGPGQYANRGRRTDNVVYGTATPSGGEAITVPRTALARQWDGWGTALKPACEDWWLLRKPLGGTVAANVAEHGTGAINIDGCRVPVTDEDAAQVAARHGHPGNSGGMGYHGADGGRDRSGVESGRWPANVIHDGSEEVLEAFAAFGEKTSNSGTPFVSRKAQQVTYGKYDAHEYEGFYGDTGTAARFFYAAKASPKERGEGNSHPTVKPLALMRYLCRLVTRPGGTVLDPFAGSGSTGVAALAEGFRFIGIEQSEEYCEIAARRLAHAVRQNLLPLFEVPLDAEVAP